MANAPNGKNVLSKFETLQPVDGKISFFDPETGRIIKVKIGKPKKSRLFSFFSLKRKSKPTTGEQATVGEVCGAYSEGEKPDYYNDQQSGAAAPSAIYHRRRALSESRNHLLELDEDDDSLPLDEKGDTDQDESDYMVVPEEVTPVAPVPPPDSPSGSDGDSYDDECEKVYRALKRKASNDYLNVAPLREPLYSKIADDRRRASCPINDEPDDDTTEPHGHSSNGL